eukprot:TRINITY_DN2060_c0_g1_i18.p1 TRINITY_DN2060_c0_g1~~TRINITY_DN2060_c0_g1_i18.p1  ORF type:complete len:404 (+),score=88.90 TRINITY_DN2060_c0_g1_i18:627-1838(+)
MHPLFGDPRFGNASQAALRNVLTAFTVYNPRLGYCQGMNFIAGFLLIISGFREEESFWAFTSIMTHKIGGDLIRVEGIEGFYSENFPLLRVMNGLFAELLGKIAPALKVHFTDIQLSEELWLSKWLSMLFLHNLPMSHCIRAWDYFIANGASGILRVSVSVLKQLSHKLLEADFGEAFEILKSLKDGGLPAAEKVISTAEKITTDWNAIEQLRLNILESIYKEESKAVSLLRSKAKETPSTFKARQFKSNVRPVNYIRKHSKRVLNSYEELVSESSSDKRESDKLPPIRMQIRRKFIVEQDANRLLTDWNIDKQNLASENSCDKSPDPKNKSKKHKKYVINLKEEPKNIVYKKRHSSKPCPLLPLRAILNEDQGGSMRDERNEKCEVIQQSEGQKVNTKLLYY